MTAGPGVEIARRIGGNLARAARRVLDRTALPREEGFWLDVAITGPLDEIPAPSPPFGRGGAGNLFELLETLATAADDPQVDGVVLHLGGPLGGMSRQLSLRRAIHELRECGKPVVVYAESLDTEGLLVASAASRIWLPEAGNVFLVGLRLESLFLRDVLAKLGVRPDVVSIGRYKSAGELFTRDAMSPEDREQREALADDLFAELVGAIADGRGLSPATVRELIDRGPYHAPAAVAAGLVDRCLYPDELEAALEELTPIPPGDRPGPRRVRRVASPLYHAARVGDPGWRPLFTGLPRIAYVVARGTIARGSGHRGISSEGYRELLEGLGRDPAIRGVVLRIDSGGGDALASDLLWRAISVVTRDKPVVVSMGDVVASGGYYMASAADWVVAEAGTVTGSIGVVGGKVDLSGLYERMGVGKDGVERGARAGLLSEARGFTPDEKRAVRDEMEALYGTFLARVAQGRGLSVDDTHAVAQGRLWSGFRASQLGLVDAIGGPLEALRSVRQRAGLRRDEPTVIERHPRRPHLPGLRDLLRSLPLR